MTTSSELFYNRRSRIGRSSDLFGTESDFGATPHLGRSNRRHNSPRVNHTRRDRIDPDGCDPFRRSLHHHYHPRQPPIQSRKEHESTRLERLRFGLSDRLPVAVVLARERLLQRLRGVTLSNTRRTSTNSYSSRDNDISLADHLRRVDAGEWETEISREWLSIIAPLPTSVNQQTNNKPPGLTENALGRLCVEIFSLREEKILEQRFLTRTIMECSICLESFSDGNELICLPCEHRYHLCCLEPWIRTCGDCPYCRRGIDSNLHGVNEIPEG